MPSYKYNGNTYDIPADKVADFEAKYQDATMAYKDGDTIYDIPVSKREKFLSKYPNAIQWDDQTQKDTLETNLADFSAQYGDFMSEYENFEKHLKAPEMEPEYLPNYEAHMAQADEYNLRRSEREKMLKEYFSNPLVIKEREGRAGDARLMAESFAAAAGRMEQDNPELAKKAAKFSMSMIPGRGPLVLDDQTKQYREDHTNYETARRFAEEAQEIYAAPSKYDDSVGVVNFLKGAKNVAGSADFWTMGMAGIADNLNARDALLKVQEKLGSIDNLTEDNINKVLSPSEAALVTAWAANVDAQARRAEDLSRGYQAGQGATESLGFMAQFLLTGGAGKAASEAATKGMTKWLAGQLGKMTPGAVRTVTKGAAKGVLGTVKSLTKAAVQTPLMPSTYENISEVMLEVDNSGKLIEADQAFWTGLADSMIETWSENAGGMVEDILGVPLKLGKSAWNKALGETSFGKWGQSLTRTPAYNLMKQAGWNGYIGELGEEWLGNSVRTLTGLDPDALKDFATIDQQIITMTSFAPMAVLGLGASAAQYKAAKNRAANAAEALSGVLQQAGYSQDQISFVLDDMNSSTPRQLSETLTPVVNQIAKDTGFGSEAFKAVMNYADAMAKYRTLDGFYQREQEAKMLDARSEIESKTKQLFYQIHDTGKPSVTGDGNVYIEEVRVVENSDGSRFFIVGQSEDGTLAAVDEQGGKRFITEDEITRQFEDGSITSDQTMMLRDFLSAEVVRNQQAAEQARMTEDARNAVAQIRQVAQPGTEVNLGTAEAPVVGIVTQVTGDGVVVQTEAGVSQLSWEEAGRVFGIDATPRTDEEIEAGEVAQIEATRAERMTRLAQTADEAAGAEIEALDALAEESVAEPLPLKADGSVDQTSLWNQNPERWAEWNDEQRQDGGVNSLGYINGAIAREEAAVAELTAAYNAEPDFDTRASMEPQIKAANERLNRLVALQQKYAPLMQAEAQQVVEGSEQAEPVVANKDRERSVESVVAALYDKGLDDAEVSANIDANIEEYEKKLAAQSKRAPKMGSDADAYLQKKQKYQEKMDEIQQELNFWTSVRQAISGLRENEMQVPEAPGAVGMEKDPEPQNAVEFAARELGLKEGGIKLQRKSFAEHTGYGNEEMKKFFGLFKSKQDGGMTVEQAGERLMEIDRENNTGFFDQDDPNAGLDAILDALSANKTIGELRSYTARRRQEEAQQEADAAYSAMMADYEAAHGMSAEEVADYNAVMRSELIQKGLNETEYNELNSIFAEEISEYDTRTEETFGRSDGEVPSDVEGGSDAVPEGSSNVLQSQQSDYTSGEGTAPEGEQSSEDVGDLYAQDGTSQVQPAAVESSLDEDMPDFLGMSDEDVVRRATEELTTEQERANLEEEKRAALRDRIKEWEQKLGVQVDVMESVDDVTNAQAKQQILNGREVFGWFEVASGKVAFYLPDYVSLPTANGLSEIDKTYIHEIVSHKGLRGLLGEEKFGELCDRVWEAMSQDDQQKYLSYPGVNGNKRIAADEYIASFAETINYESNLSAWDKIVSFVKDILNSIGIQIGLSENDLASLLHASYNKLVSENSAGKMVEKISLDEYLGRLGLSSPISDYMDDKLRNPHGLTESQRNQLEKEAAEAATDYQNRRSAAIEEYNRLVSEGSIIPPTQIDSLLAVANGHPDNPATQAARRSLEKRGYDWQTGQKLTADKVEKKISEADSVSEEVDSSQKIEDFGEKIGGARKDVARAKIRNSVNLSGKDLKELKDPDKILSRKQIVKYFNEGQMTLEDAQTMLAANMAVRSADTSYKELALTKYRDMAVAWEKGEDFGFNLNESDIDMLYNRYDQKMKDKVPDLRDRVAKSLRVLLFKAYDDYKNTYEALKYPAEYRDLKSLVIQYGIVDTKYWVLSSANARRGTPKATMLEAVAYVKNHYPIIEGASKSGQDAGKSEDDKKETYGHLHVVKSRYGGYRIKSRVIPGDVYISNKEFYSKKTAEAYLKENAERLVERERTLEEALMGSNIGMVERRGEDYRNGKDVTPQDFLDTFGFRGVEFGNWVPQAERQMYLNKTYDAIMDFCKVIGISPKAFTLGGRLAIGFGSRGKSRAMAHYEPVLEVINLTRMHGAGSLAHEWFHALDNFLAKQKTGNTSDMITDVKDAVREEVVTAFTDFVKKMDSLPYTRRSRRAGDYWGEVWERAARLFENYVYNELGGKGMVSPLLVRKDTLYEETAEDFGSGWWPYPSERENAEIKPYFDALFDALQEQVQEDGNVVLYRAKPEVDENVAGLETLVERIYRTTGAFSFSGSNVIESSDDVAYIFRQLEDSAVKNSFLVFVKDGVPTILHTGMGNVSSTFIDNSVVLPAYKDYGADKVYMVHNHPSGTLRASQNDLNMLLDISNQLPGVSVEGIIIDTTSGEYGVFDLDSASTNTRNMPESGEEAELTVLSFDRNVFSPDYKVNLNERKISNAEDVASFLSAHRLGEGSKVGALLLNIGNVINGNLVTNENEVSMDNADLLARQIAEAANRTGSTSVILFGDFDYSTKAIRQLEKQIVKASGKTVSMLDVVRLAGKHTQSMMEETLPYRSTLNDGVRFRMSNENQAIFVSNAAKAVEGIKQEKATPEQWLKMLEKAGGLKAGEDKWMGLSDWLKASDKKTLTKQEMLDFINENMIIIEEQHYSEDENALDGKRQEIQEALQGIFDEYVAESEDMNDDMFMKTHYDYAIQKLADELGYTAFNAPFINNNALVELDFYEDDLDTLHELNNKLGLEKYDGTRDINDTRLSYTTDGLTNKHEIALTVPTIESWNETDEVHFGDAGDGRAIAWIRFGETEVIVRDATQSRLNEIYDRLAELEMKLYSTGITKDEYDERARLRKERDEHQEIEPKTQRVLVIDEIQSKRHQEGRESGYKISREKADAEMDKFMKQMHDKYEFSSSTPFSEVFNDEEMRELARLNMQQHRATFGTTSVPDAPFDKNWHELAMKRMLRYAAENGYDVIAWTTGDQQNQRYGLSKVIDEIYVASDFASTKNEESSFRMILKNGNDNHVGVNKKTGIVTFYNENPQAIGKPLSDLLGKELADKILAARDYQTFSGVDFELSEGMKGFYDKMLPAFMNKYGKKWGVKVEDIELPNLKDGLTMHSVPVTEEMKASVMEGQVMFRVRGENESAEEFHGKAIANYLQTFNEVAPIRIGSLESKAALAKSLDVPEEKITDEVFEAILAGYEQGGYGGYIDALERIVIFAREEANTTELLEQTLFHESIHKIDSMDIEDGEEFGEWLWENADNIEDLSIFRDMIEANPLYEDDGFVEEMLANSISWYMMIGEIDNLLGQIPEEFRETLNTILNEIGYETEDQSRLRQDPKSVYARAKRLFRQTVQDAQRKRNDQEGIQENSLRFRATEITPEVRAEMDTIAATAIVNGNYMKAPNGADTNLTAEQWAMVRTKNFKNWFGDWENDPENASKVVDENGEPKVVYHGTPNEFWQFKKAAIGSTNDPGFWGEGFYFTPQEALAYHYAQGGRILPVFLSIRNPYDIQFFTQEFYDHIERFGMFGDKDFSSSRLTSELTNEGKDGVVVRRGPDERDTEYVAFDPSQIKSATDNTGEFSEEEGDIRFSIRTKPAPKETITVYKLVRLGEDGQPYPLYIGSAEPMLVRTWLDADSPNLGDLKKLPSGVHLINTKTGESMTLAEFEEAHPEMKNTNKRATNPTAEAINWATMNGMRFIKIVDTKAKQTRYSGEKRAYYNLGIDGSGSVSLYGMRPGWHAGSHPVMRQIGNGPEKNLRADNLVWVRGRISADVDYQAEANANPGNDIPTHIPTDGYYLKATNANAKASQADRMGWYIAGSFIIDEFISDAEARRVIDEWNEKHPDKKLEYDFPRESGVDFDPETDPRLNKVNFRVTGTPTDEVVASGLSLSPAQAADLAGNIFAALPESARAEVTASLNGDILGLQDAIMQIPARLAMKENWDEEDRKTADAIAEQLTDVVGKEMTRPFSAPEALWLLYNALNKATDLISEAQRVLVQRNLGFDPQTQEMIDEAKDGVRFRTVGDASDNARASMYNKGAVNVRTRLKEVFTDMYASVEELVSAMEKSSGKVAQGFENILLALNQQSSKGLAAMERYEKKYLGPMLDEVKRIIKDSKKTYEDVVRYVILKHGLERNETFAKRDAREFYSGMFDKVAARMKTQSHAQRVVSLSDAKRTLADIESKIAGATGKKLERLKEERELAMQEVTIAELVLRGDEKQNEADLKARMDAIDAGTDAKYLELRDTDYSGITSMFYDQLDVNRADYETEEEYQAALMLAKNDRYKTLADVEAAAQQEVDAFESGIDTTALWNKINAATKEILRQQYQSNMISKDQYESLRDMFQYYVPLRGFADNTAEDMYTYYRRPNSTGYTKPILGAEGRKTEAESPFGWIAAMAGSAIASNVKNEAKLALFYFVSNRPDNGIATISKTWFEFSHTDPATGKKVYKAVYPPFTEDLSSDAAKAAYEQWQKDMEAKRAAGQAYESGQRLNLGNSVVNISDVNKPEHIVTVKVGGKDYTIIINGNPRAAQAINGDLNIEATGSADYSKVLGPWLRWLSNVNTSYNPEFWFMNMQRDMLFTLMNVSASQTPEYRKKFANNYMKAFKVVSLVAKNEKDTIGDSYIENMYKDFVEYGGVTGYTQIKDSETWEKEIERMMNSANMEDKTMAKVLSGTKDVLHAFHRFGESLEQVSRFAAFMTSREMGKSMAESISDAKEITVNFNRKGSGKMISWEETKHLTDKNGQPLNIFERMLVWGVSSMAPLGRRFIMFFNAAIQGLNAMYRLYKNNPSKMAGWSLGYAAVGVMQALLHGMLDDDDDYLDIPQYERRTALLLGANGVYFKWALPQEARAFYALGELAVESIMGRNPHQNIIAEALKIASDVAPINPAEGVMAVVPSQIKPLVELWINKDWKGDPIYNDQKWLSKEEKRRTAKHSSAFKGTGKLYIDISKGLNRISGGDNFDAGLINLQPEKMEHIVQSAFGGTIRTIDKFFNSVIAAVDPDEPVTVRQLPFINRFLTINDERFKNVHVNDVYDWYAGEAEHALTLQKKYKKVMDSKAYGKLIQSDEYRWAQIYSRYKKPIKNLQEQIKVADGTVERMDLMKRQDELKRQMIKEISQLP